jgi:UDP-N-acetylglucosamine--N-acetylmuramyl-(pentapeptide) pyrophosphoryl-undecaprenol N-acetylglucosamine transferase
MSSGRKKIVIAAGGTAGHVVPALAVADALRSEGAEVEFIGSERAEARIVPAAGYPLHTISVEGLSRGNPLRAIRTLVRAAAAVGRARAILAALAPDAVMGGGGYVAGPVALAALTRRIPIVLTEADSRLGLTNRMLAPFARRVCLSFPPSPPERGSRWRARGRPPSASARERQAGKFRVTGRPLFRHMQDRGAARERFGVEPEQPCVLVFGGSLGSQSINHAALAAFTGSSFHVLHVCGSRDYPALAAGALPAGYDLREYLPEADFPEALAAADLVVARSGGSVFELAAHSLPAILVPYPRAAGDHQSANAAWMSAAGAAIVIPDDELTPSRLAREVASLFADRSRLAAMASASGRLARPQAAAEVAGELLEAARR